MRILLIAILLISCFSLRLAAQVRGKIVDGQNHMGLPGATISGQSGNIYAISEPDGTFYIENLSADTLWVSFVGYETKKVVLDQPQRGLVIYLTRQDQLLSEVTVSAFEHRGTLLESPGAIAVLDDEQLNRFGTKSLVSSLNTIPGLRMEQRSPGSYRINIRGSALRAPFDVRNVKVYWNGIPLTEPGGNTPLNVLDVINFGRVEVIKGPGGSIYGAGTGGVINIASAWPEAGKGSVEAGFTAGSFGLSRQTISLKAGSDKSLVTLNYARQKTDGYRDHSALHRDNVEFSGKFTVSERQSLSAHLLYTDLSYEIPGGLTLEQYRQDPTQARPGNDFVLGSIASNASIHVKNFLFGLTHDYRWGEDWQNVTTVYGKMSDFDHPFNLDYKKEAQQEAGGRSVFHYNTAVEGFAFSFGGEFQSRLAAARNYGNNMGMPDTLNFEDELRTSQGLVFARGNVDLPLGFYLTAGISYNKVIYDIYRLSDAALDSSFRIDKHFPGVWAPRIGISKLLHPALSVHGSISYGFSPPTLEEVRTNEGSVNTSLKPEKGMNYEIGLRGVVLNNRLNFDLTAFYFKLDETIVDYTSPRGTDLFRNAGNTSQKGIELATSYTFTDNPLQFISLLNWQTSYAGHYFTFDRYKKEEDYSGNDLPGVAPHTVVNTLIVENRHGLYVNVSHNFTDRIPLNDANTVYARSYHLVKAKAGFKTPVLDLFEVDIFAGVDNLLDETYSLGNDLNAFGGRYYQPSAARSFYGGVQVRYLFSKG